MKRILVVDDNPAMRQLLTEVLRADYIVKVVRNGVEALNALREWLPDAILLDLAMPVMDGWTFLKVRRDKPEFARVPVLILSAELPDESMGETIEVQARVAKPFDVDCLLATIRRLVARKETLSR